MSFLPNVYIGKFNQNLSPRVKQERDSGEVDTNCQDGFRTCLEKIYNLLFYMSPL